MNDELDRYYELLGVAPGASGQELKEAYRDLAKVWHPDRFSHDPRLQQKAQEKLKEINEAYAQLTSGTATRRPRPAPARPEPQPSPAPDWTHAPAVATVARKENPQRPRLLLPIALVFCAAFVVALVSLVPSGARPAPELTTPAEEREEARAPDKGPQPEGATRAAAAAQPTPLVKERAGRQPPADATSGGDSVSEPSVRQLRPMPTVTVNIDPMTGLLATRDCPNVSTLTYPAGNEPRRYCAVQHKTKIVPQSEPAQSKGSRLKSTVKRLAEPFK